MTAALSMQTLVEAQRHEQDKLKQGVHSRPASRLLFCLPWKARGS
jgi:hypothetical protein